MLHSVRAGSDSLYTRCASACRPETKSLVVMACLAIAPLICANTVCGQESARGLTATVSRPVQGVIEATIELRLRRDAAKDLYRG